jgi:plastocyanin
VRTLKALLAVLAGAARVSAAPAHGAPKKTVRVGDDYLLPAKLTVKRGTTVTWRWPGFGAAGDVHDVGLASGPKRVKKFRSEAASTDYTYKRKLTVPGTYRLNCSLHHEMRMTIKVRR